MEPPSLFQGSNVKDLTQGPMGVGTVAIMALLLLTQQSRQRLVPRTQVAPG